MVKDISDFDPFAQMQKEEELMRASTIMDRGEPKSYKEMAVKNDAVRRFHDFMVIYKACVDNNKEFSSQYYLGSGELLEVAKCIYMTKYGKG